MSQVVPAGANLPALPAFLKSLPRAPINDDLKSGMHTGVSVPRISIKGAKFHLVENGEVETVQKPDSDGELAPVSSLAVVILGANKGLYKTFYAKKFDPDSDEATAPECYSYDGVVPSPMSTAKQAEACAGCPQNVWGSKITEQGNKTRACSDNKLLAVMATGGITNELGLDNIFGKVYQVKVTPSALSRSRADRNADPSSPHSFAEFVDGINAYPVGGGETASVPVRAVSVKLFFDIKAQYPLLRFKLGRFLTEKEHQYAELRAEGDDVKAAITESQVQAVVQPAKPVQPKLVAPPPPKKEDDDGEDVVMATRTTDNGFVAPKEEAPPPRKVAVDPESGEDIPATEAKKRGRPAKAAAPAEPAKQAAPITPVSSDMDEDLAGLVGRFNGSK